MQYSSASPNPGHEPNPNFISLFVGIGGILINPLLLIHT